MKIYDIVALTVYAVMNIIVLFCIFYKRSEVVAFRNKEGMVTLAVKGTEAYEFLKNHKDTVEEVRLR